MKTRPVEIDQTRCLDSTGAWACAEGRAADSKVLKRLRTLLLYGQWGATHRDVPHIQYYMVSLDSGFLRGSDECLA